ncbi:pep a2 [Streptomyces sp. WAC 01529]|uniref:pep a2 n=1 Tax=Streptomyces sp. WAC 01529 TaxID=2203205 RepID=UPI001F0CA390|nr:pep a2 [Streptomyces sp. WAC 01529]
MKTAIPCYYHLEVEISPERIDQVRRILAAHLRHWGLGILVEPVCHCAGVLLRAVEEHGTDKNAVVEMWWSGQHLITAVSDNERDLPDPHYGPQGYLAQIAALSDGWGNYPGTNGKIIWFSHRARCPERAPLAPTTPAPALRVARPLPREVPVAALATPAEEEPVVVGAAPGAHAQRADASWPRMVEHPTASSPEPHTAAAM